MKIWYNNCGLVVVYVESQMLPRLGQFFCVKTDEAKNIYVLLNIFSN